MVLKVWSRPDDQQQRNYTEIHIFNSYLQITQSETWGRVQYLPSPDHSADLMWGLTSLSSLPVLRNKCPVGPFAFSLRQFSD